MLSTGKGMLSIGTTTLGGHLNRFMHPFLNSPGGGELLLRDRDIAVLRERDKQGPTKQEHLPGADVG